ARERAGEPPRPGAREGGGLPPLVRARPLLRRRDDRRGLLLRAPLRRDARAQGPALPGGHADPRRPAPRLLPHALLAPRRAPRRDRALVDAAGAGADRERTPPAP